MKFVQLTSVNSGKPIQFNIDEIAGMVDHVETEGGTHEAMSFVWLKGIQQAFGVKEPTEVIIERMRGMVVA